MDKKHEYFSDGLTFWFSSNGHWIRCDERHLPMCDMCHAGPDSGLGRPCPRTALHEPGVVSDLEGRLMNLQFDVDFLRKQVDAVRQRKEHGEYGCNMAAEALQDTRELVERVSRLEKIVGAHEDIVKGYSKFITDLFQEQGRFEDTVDGLDRRISTLEHRPPVVGAPPSCAGDLKRAEEDIDNLACRLAVLEGQMGKVVNILDRLTTHYPYYPADPEYVVSPQHITYSNQTGDLEKKE